MDDYLLGVFLVTYSSKGYHLPFKYPETVFDSYRNRIGDDPIQLPKEVPIPTIIPSLDASLNNSNSKRNSYDSLNLKDGTQNLSSIPSLQSKSNKLPGNAPLKETQNADVIDKDSLTPVDSASQLGSKQDFSLQIDSPISSPAINKQASSLLSINTDDAMPGLGILNKHAEFTPTNTRNHRKGRESKGLFYYKTKKNPDPADRTINTNENAESSNEKGIKNTSISSLNPIDNLAIKDPTNIDSRPIYSKHLDENSLKSSTAKDKIPLISDLKNAFSKDHNDSFPDFNEIQFKAGNTSNIDILDPSISLNSTDIIKSSSFIFDEFSYSDYKNKVNKPPIGLHSAPGHNKSNKNSKSKLRHEWIHSKIYGFDTKLLAQLLSARPSKNYRRFHVGIDDLSFLGYPIRENVLDSKEDKVSNAQTQRSDQKIKHFKSYKKPHAQSENDHDNSWRQFEKSFLGASTTTKPSTKENFTLPSFVVTSDNNLLTDSESAKTSRPPTLRTRSSSLDNRDIKPPLSINLNLNQTPKKYSSMFHVVFMINGNSPLVEKYNNSLYNCVLKPLTSALKWEQQQSNWVYKESLLMRDLYKLAVNENWSMETYFEKLFESSVLANSLREIYNNIIKMKCTHLIINNNIPISIQLPNTPLIVRKATQHPSAQAWSYFQPNKLFEFTQPTPLLENSQIITSSLLLSYINSNLQSSQRSSSKLKTPLNFNISTQSKFGDKPFYFSPNKIQDSKDEFYDAPFDNSEYNSFKNSGAIQKPSLVDYFGLNNNKNLQSATSNPVLVSLLGKKEDRSIYKITELLEFLEFESNVIMGAFDSQYEQPLSHRNISRMKNRISYSQAFGSINSKSFNKYAQFSSSRATSLRYIIANYRKILSPGSFPQTSSNQFPGISRNLVSSGETSPSNYNAYPTIEPYHSLLLLNSPEDILSRIGSDSSPSLIRLIKKATPIQPLAELHPLIDCSFAQICRLCAHLVYWGEARIICPASVKNIYMISPKTSISDYVRKYEHEFSRKFPGYCLPLVLSYLNRHEIFKNCIESVPVLENYDPNDSILSRNISRTNIQSQTQNTTKICPNESFNVSRTTSAFDLKEGKDSFILSKAISRSNSMKEFSTEKIDVELNPSSALNYVEKAVSNSIIVSNNASVAQGKKLAIENAKKDCKPGIEQNYYPDTDTLHREILIYLLKTNIIAQKHAWPILLVPLYVKLGLKESQHKLLLKKQWKKSKEIQKTLELDLKNEFGSDFYREKSNNFDDFTSMGSQSDSGPENGNSVADGFLKNYYFSWRPTSGFASASASERSYLQKLVANKPPNHVKWFLDKTIYFNGKHHVDEILFREFLTISQFFQLMKPFKDLVIMTFHY
ncbi:Nitrogen permease regulator 3-like protein [Smittium culicis]|uniref:Nitrogen permease regulator 3-like protein n=1 Tax=Smittium culicis TaxID=133412 RepID=A0A1R1Y0B3_9FUNG|nr:Nitrogen permease regulator 3-like protein [Smittium culicis]OMJ23204.1 Nitrogen permease regulator 3-like protein [Smittium culicis]